MQSKYPTDEERKKLQKMADRHKSFSVYLIILSLAPLLITHLLDNHPVLQLALYIITFIGLIYMMINYFFIGRRCPRCSVWGTPVTGGNCPRCGLYLDPSAVKPHDNN